MKGFVFGLLVALSSVGCVTSSDGPSKDALAKLKNGFTTKRDVIGYFGNPDSIEGNDIWIYNDNRSIGGQAKLDYMMSLLVMSNMQSETFILRLEFVDEVLKSWTLGETAPDKFVWKISPL